MTLSAQLSTSGLPPGEDCHSRGSEALGCFTWIRSRHERTFAHRRLRWWGSLGGMPSAMHQVLSLICNIFMTSLVQAQHTVPGLGEEPALGVVFAGRLREMVTLSNTPVFGAEQQAEPLGSSCATLPLLHHSHSALPPLSILPGASQTFQKGRAWLRTPGIPGVSVLPDSVTAQGWG